MEINFEKYIIELNEAIPPKYFQRNRQQYAFTTYINHALFLSQAGEFEGAVIFSIRAFKFLNEKPSVEIDESYLNISKKFLIEVIAYSVENKLIKKSTFENLQSAKLINE